MVVLKYWIAGVCLLLSMVAFWLMPQQLETVGFAARHRDPNPVAYFLSLGAGLLGLLNLLVLVRSKQMIGVLVASVVMVGLLLLDGYLYVATW